MILEVVLFFIVLYLVTLLFPSEKGLPPGPWEIPLLGSLPLITLPPCIKMREKYGDVFKTRTGAVTFVYIADYKLAKEALNRIELADRPKWNVFQMFEEERQRSVCSGVIMSNGFKWHQTRRFLLRNLRDLGMGKSKIEDIILREVEILVEDFKTLTKEPSPLPFTLNVCILNVIWQLVAGHRYDFHDEKLRDFMKIINDVQDNFMWMGLRDFFPFLKYVIPEKILDLALGKATISRMGDEFCQLMQPFIDDHLAKLDPDNLSDLMDEYLYEMKQQSEEYSHFSNTDLTRTLFDLFVAGNDTTSNMTQWVLLYMAKHQQTQKKIQEEIDKIVPRDRIPALEHRERLSYLDATINEVQRHASLVPLGVMRETKSEINVNGYRIPKDVVVCPVSGICHMDPKYWENPSDFDPSRFLDANGKFISQREGFLPFGVGKRQCLGEAFARMELFLITAALLQNFTFGPPEGAEVDLNPRTPPQMQMPKKEQKLSIKIRK